MTERNGDGERYYIVQTSGYVGDGPQWEHEFAVVDSVSTLTVGLFIVERNRWSSRSFEKRKITSHIRARRLCKALNNREREVAFDPVALADRG